MVIKTDFNPKIFFNLIVKFYIICEKIPNRNISKPSILLEIICLVNNTCEYRRKRIFIISLLGIK
ncbi:hypothetical protein BpHYR1_024395 [Brachionus plicatilis]|uniref:Uncharacterized protein n=1 Tax=Brachionus plicatilis TaxID=10195 RepID=A0A3M7QRT5_BRAPC|nr:hypothetical protein BpHYR1_024395 [Brachionus plicatilis]